MFDVYVETRLAPKLEPGTVVILDNLVTHKFRCCRYLTGTQVLVFVSAALQSRSQPNKIGFLQTQITLAADQSQDF